MVSRHHLRLASLVLLALGVAACAGPRRAAPLPPSSTAIPAAPPRGEPAGMIGLSDAQLRARFGAPAFVRKDGAAEIWRYDGGCRAFFFLYGEAGAQRVRHVETLPHGAGVAADASCLAALGARQPS